MYNDTVYDSFLYYHYNQTDWLIDGSEVYETYE